MSNTKTEQHFNPGLALIGFSGTRPWTLNLNSGEYYKGDNTSNHGQHKTSNLAVFAHLETLDKLM